MNFIILSLTPSLPRRTHHSNGLHGEEDGAEEEWHAAEGRDGGSLAHGRDVREDVEGDDREADDGDDVGKGAEGREKLEVAHPVDEDERQQQDQHVDPDVEHREVLVSDLREKESLVQLLR